MPSNLPIPDERGELVATLRHALDRTLLLARRLSDDPLVGTEARGFLGRLESIQAEVDMLSSSRIRPRPLNDGGERLSPTRLWN